MRELALSRRSAPAGAAIAADVLRPPDRARRPAGRARAVRAHRHRPHDAARRTAIASPQRIERSLASFAGTATRADACYVFVLVEARQRRPPERVVGISAIEAAVGLKRALVQLPRRHAGARVARARRLHGRADAVPRQRPHRAHRALLAVPRPGATGTARTAPLLAKCRLLFIAEFARALRAEGDRRVARPARRATAAARSGKASAGTSSRWSTRPPTT